MFGKAILADEIAKVINDTIMSLPERDPRVRRMELLNGPTVNDDTPVEVECAA